MNDNNGSLTYNTRFDLAIKAFEHTAEYDGMIANYFGARLDSTGCEQTVTPARNSTYLQHAADQEARPSLR